MIRKSDDLVGSLVHDVAHGIRTRIDARLRPWRLTRQKWLALGLIRDHPDMTQADLAARLELGAATTGRLVDRLRERGFVRRLSDSSDRRAYRLRVTPEAEALLARIADMADTIRAEVLDGIGPAEIEIAERALKRMKANLARLSVGAMAMAVAVLAQAGEMCRGGCHGLV